RSLENSRRAPDDRRALAVEPHEVDLFILLSERNAQLPGNNVSGPDKRVVIFRIVGAQALALTVPNKVTTSGLNTVISEPRAPHIAIAGNWGRPRQPRVYRQSGA